MTVISSDPLSDVGAGLGGIIIVAGSVYTYLKQKGIIDIIVTKLTAVSYEEAKAIQDSNGNALTKLNMSDELVEYLQKLAPSEDGTIDEEKAIQALRDCIHWNNRLITKIPLSSDMGKKK